MGSKMLSATLLSPTSTGAAGAGLDDAGATPGASDMPKGDGAGEPVHIAADQLPPGIKEGDCLRCTGMDESGCTFEIEAGEGGEKKEEGTPWEEDFRASMSPKAPQEGAM